MRKIHFNSQRSPVSKRGAPSTPTGGFALRERTRFAPPSKGHTGPRRCQRGERWRELVWAGHPCCVQPEVDGPGLRRRRPRWRERDGAWHPHRETLLGALLAEALRTGPLPRPAWAHPGMTLHPLGSASLLSPESLEAGILSGDCSAQGCKRDFC